MNTNAELVTLEEVLAAVALKRASLVPETSGYLALAVGDATERLPFRLEDRAVTLSVEGTVSVARGTEVVTEEQAARTLRDLLRRLLDVSAGSMPGLDAAARRREREAGGVAGVVTDIEGALIPVNRAAARRALARLARETLRAKLAGKLGRKRALVAAEAVPVAASAQAETSPPAATVVNDGAVEIIAPEPQRVAPAPVAPPDSADVSGDDLLAEACEPPPRLDAAPQPTPIATEGASPTDETDDIVVDWTASPPAIAPVAAAPAELEADEVSSSLPPVEPTVVARETDVLSARVPSAPEVTEEEAHADAVEAAPEVARDETPTVALPERAAPETAPAVDDEASQPSATEDAAMPEGGAAPEDMTIFDPRVVPVATGAPPEVVVEPTTAPPTCVAIDESELLAAVAASAAAEAAPPAIAQAEPAPPPRRAVASFDDAPKSSVEDLLSSFGGPADDRVIKAVAADLKSLAGLEPTPPPPGAMPIRSPTPPPVRVEPAARPAEPPVAPSRPPPRRRVSLALPLVLLVIAVVVTLAAYRPDLLALASLR